MYKYYILTLLVLLTGCAQHYEKPGSSPATVTTDQAACHHDAVTAAGTDANAALIRQEEAKCMRLKGYEMKSN